MEDLESDGMMIPGEAGATFQTGARTAAEAAFRHLTRLTKLYVEDSSVAWVAALPLLSTLQVRCIWEAGVRG